MRYAIVINGVVDNVVEWDGVTTYSPPGQLIQNDTVNVGDLWDGSQFTTPAPLQSKTAAAVPLTADQKLAKIGMTLSELKAALASAV